MLTLQLGFLGQAGALFLVDKPEVSSVLDQSSLPERQHLASACHR
jgi:hypothetical protein